MMAELVVMATFFSLGSVWIQLLGRSYTKQHDVSLIVLRPAKLLVSTVEPI